MHIFQVPRTCAVAPVRVTPAPDLPEGFLVDTGDHLNPTAILHQGWTLAADGLRMSVRPLSAKAFVPAQPIRAEAAGWTLVISPLASDGVDAGVLDHGLPTQVYFSPADRGYIELEQCSDLLRPAAGGDGVHAEVVLSAEPARSR
jgi:hypothetical protein